MKDEQKYQDRHWAETIRLYAGWLNEAERNIFIKDLAGRDILLAAETRANIFKEEPDLDEFLSQTATDCARNRKKSKVSANGLLALTILERYDKILEVFSGVDLSSDKFFYSGVIEDFIWNGTESQILNLMRILGYSNLVLFEKALDSVLEKALTFGIEAKEIGLSLLNVLNLTKNRVLRCKLICIFELSEELLKAQEIMEILLQERQIKYAHRLSVIRKLKGNQRVLDIFNDCVNTKLSRAMLNLFLKTMENLVILFDVSEINLTLAKSLDPRIKQLSLSSMDGSPIPGSLALSIYKANIRLANLSSIEFADQVISQFNLEGQVRRDEIILSLLNSQKTKSVELAYRFIKQYSLYDKFNFRMVFGLLVGNLTIESVTIARRLVLEEFPFNERHEMLLYLASVCYHIPKFKKFTRQIMLEDLNQYRDFNLSDYGEVAQVVGYNRGVFQLVAAKNVKVFGVSKKKYNLNVNDFVTFQNVRKKPANQNDEMETIIILKNILSHSVKRFRFNRFYIGEVIEIDIFKVEEKSVIGRYEDSDLQFVIPIYEISEQFIRNLNDHVEEGGRYKVIVKRFVKDQNKIICSLKDLELDSYKHFDNKLEKLKNKYSRQNTK